MTDFQPAVSGPPPSEGNGASQGRRSDIKQACTLLYAAQPTLDAARLRADLSSFVGPCSVEWAEATASGLPVRGGVARWDDHQVAMLAINAPIKPEVLAATVGVSPMPGELRLAMTSHRASIRLLYTGDDPSPLGQLTALYSVAGALLMRSGLGIINERAALGQPTELVAGYLPELGGNAPPLGLWVGVVTYTRESEGPSRRYLLRTYGLEQFDLPELAIYMSDLSAPDACYHILLNIGLYMIESGPNMRMAPGHTAEFLKQTYLFTEPGSNDPEFASPTGLFLLVDV